ncbi:MAG TPA: arginine--tRNA ligase [Chitinophagaceae bacterium]|nr:arginine--tRNA ligase [Chitinophagaceae bacterium]
MAFTNFIRQAVITGLEELYHQSFAENDFQINETKQEFEGDYTIVLFSLVKKLKLSPETLAKSLGEYLVNRNPGIIAGYNVIKAFLNLTLADDYLQAFLNDNYQNEKFGEKKPTGRKIMVEYSSPNTNKPLHLGHLRNIFLGWSTAEILKATGNNVVKTCVVNDRGIHICKSMIAWQKFANGATPESTHTKGDHFVGDYYVKFNDEYKNEVKELTDKGIDEKQAEKDAPIMKEAQQMLLDWEQGKPDVVQLWKTMNGWVYKGFDKTYKRIGADFDQIFYESNTYLSGREFVRKGLEDGSFYKKEDGSVWIDLTEAGMDEKLLLRGDGTSVYITQDIGLAKQKFEDYKLDESIYVIGDEQIYHMKVLKEICKKLGMPFYDKIFHLSYGMVELTTGKMKSREGTVVDADDLVDEMIDTAKHHTETLGKVNDFTGDELRQLYETLGLGAMKFYLLRVDPKKRMVFNPRESIDFHGFTGPFVQYTYARIQSILRKFGDASSMVNRQWSIVNGQSPVVNPETEREKLLPLERQLIISLEKFDNAVVQAAEELNPSVIANYVFQLAQTYNSFYTEHSVANAENEVKKNLRIGLSVMTANVIKSSLHLLGIQVPERM